MYVCTSKFLYDGLVCFLFFAKLSINLSSFDIKFKPRLQTMNVGGSSVGEVNLLFDLAS